MKSPGGDYSVIIETSGAKSTQKLSFKIDGDLSHNDLCVWRSNASEQFVRQADIHPAQGNFTIELDSNAIYSLSTTTGQQKGAFAEIPADKPFPFPYYETFQDYASPEKWGYLPRYTADITSSFELVESPDKKGMALRQVVPVQPINWAPDWLPYTIIGDEHWTDYEVSANVWLEPGSLAGIMGRVNDVGNGYGCTPKGYFLRLASDGQCELAAICGRLNKKELGDAEHQAILKASGVVLEEGEKQLAVGAAKNIAPGQWHNLKLRFSGTDIQGLVDGVAVVSAKDTRFSHGMAGLMAGNNKKRSTPFFGNLLINAVNAPTPQPTSLLHGPSPIYEPIMKSAARTGL